MNVLLLMAGSDDAFRDAGFAFPKNLVEIGGLPLVQRVLARVRTLTADGHRLVCCVKHDEDRQYHTGQVIRLLEPSASVVLVPGPTGGAACTALLAIESIAPDEPLLVVNGDQLLEQDLAPIVRGFAERGLDGGVVVFEAVHPRWSYVKVDAEGLVVEAAEKRPISNLATAGVYWFARGGDFLRGATETIRKNAQVGGLFYVCPVYNELVLARRRVGVHAVPRDAYHSLSDPQGVQAYAERLRSAGAA